MLVRLNCDLEWLASKSGRPGQPETISDVANPFCHSVKVLVGLALRRTIEAVASLPVNVPTFPSQEVVRLRKAKVAVGGW